MSTTLTDRYIFATVSTLPPATQADVRQELRASIADAVDAHLEQGLAPAEAERAVLTELGDPALLAAGYAERPMHLIGPRYYLTWWRLVKLLLAIVPACVVAAVAAGQSLAGASIGTIAGQAIGAGFSVGVHLCFWVTLVFVILERTGTEAGVKWSVDQLSEPARTGTGRGDLIAALVFVGLAIGAVLWDHFIGLVHVGGAALSILNPELWPVWTVGLLALLVLEGVFAVALYLRGRWSLLFAVVNTSLAVLVLSWAMTLFGRGELINPQLVDVVFTANGVTDETLRILATILGCAIVGFSLWDIFDGWAKTRRDARRLVV